MGAPYPIPARVEALERADYTCENCGARPEKVLAHHLTYENYRCETVDDYRILCRSCHSRAHHADPGLRSPKYLNRGGQAISINADQLARIDKLRGLVARTVYTRYLLEKGLKAEEKTQARKSGK